LRLPVELRRTVLHLLLRDQHEDLQVHRLVSLQDHELLSQIAVLQERQLLLRSVLLLHDELLQLRFLR
jgi:hypothetical protein